MNDLQLILGRRLRQLPHAEVVESATVRGPLISAAGEGAMLKGVFFDLDETLIDADGRHREASRRAFAAFGMDWDEALRRKPASRTAFRYSDSVRSKRGTANSGASAEASVNRQRSTQGAGLKELRTTQATLVPCPSRIHRASRVMKQGWVMLKASIPPGRSTRKASAIARSKPGPSIMAMKETTASKLAEENISRRV